MWAKSGIQVATVLGDDKVQGMIIGGRGGNEGEVSFVGIETGSSSSTQTLKSLRMMARVGLERKN